LVEGAAAKPPHPDTKTRGLWPRVLVSTAHHNLRSADCYTVYVSTFTLIYIFFDKYAVPFLFAVGLFYFLYGCIEYFIIGKGGDEERSQHGRELFLKSIAWFFLSLLLYLLVIFVGWLTSLSLTGVINPGPSGGGVDVNQDSRVLPIPNVPTR
jgi:uncharacterized membrane protein